MALTAKSIRKDFYRAGKNSNIFTAVQTLDLELEEGKLIEITGRSGSGKSTLLNMLAGLLKPTDGQVFLDEDDLYALDDEKRSRLRNGKVGLIPQGHMALLGLTVLENVLLPAVLYSKGHAPEKRGAELLGRVGLADMSNEKPNALSGGELRRMAVARALLMRPKVILADEPTAGLDEENILAVMGLLRDAADKGASVLLVTHENEAARFADKILHMDGGRFI